MTITCAFLFIMFGGALGALTRFLTQECFSAWTRLPGWAAIFVVNMVGCLIIGFGQVWLSGDLADAVVAGTADQRMFEQQSIHYGMDILLVGFCGGMTTFSTFTLDNFFLSHGKFVQFGFNVVGSVTLGFFMVLFGMWLGHQVVAG